MTITLLSIIVPLCIIWYSFIIIDMVKNKATIIDILFIVIMGLFALFSLILLFPIAMDILT